MADQIDYRALFEQAERSRKEIEARAKEAEARAEDAEARAKDAETRIEDAETRVKEVEKQLAKTTFPEFLDICHTNVFMKLDVEKNKLLTTTGGMTKVDGKQYPRCLKPWNEFPALHEESFAIFERAFQLQQLFPSPAGLGYLSDKLSDKKLASEEDLKNFECLAVEGCALDVFPRFLELANTDVTIFPTTDLPHEVSFNNYPFGVIATEADEESEPEAGPEQDDNSSQPREASRGRSLQRSSAGGSRKKKPLIIKDDRPAYIGALGVAKRDMDEAIARAAAEAEERELLGPPKKRHSPERTKVRPDQWCFRHSVEEYTNVRPLFVIEYKAAHKIDKDLLRDCLEPEAAASLMEDAIWTVAGRSSGELSTAKRDIAKVFTQTFHYMVDYGLQYSYATTGNALLFLYLDPKQPSTLYYHLEEPERAVQSSQREDIKRSAVALVLSFMLMSLKGQHMTQRWKKNIHKEQPKWPQPYEDMKDMSTNTPNSLSLTTTTVTLAPKSAEASKDPQKRSGMRRQHQDGDCNLGPTSESSRRTESSSWSTLETIGTGTTQSEEEPEWSYSVHAPPSPALPFCTQACLLGLKTGGTKDLHCPNAHLHRRRDAADVVSADERHPITADELRAQLTHQLANDMDHDCQNLERYGMYGAIGSMFKLALSEYGYCILGKGVQRAHRKRLEKEAMTYSFLEACQGRLVPVVLGVIELVDEYWTECGAHISHMMLMTFAGDSLWHHSRKKKSLPLYVYEDEIVRTLKELEPYGVEHGDENNNNMVWNEEQQRVMVIDFDYATVWQQQSVEVEPQQELAADGQDRRRKALEEHDTQQPKRAKLGHGDVAVEA